MSKDVEMVTVSVEKYNQLVEDQGLLCALQAAGVDNWEGCGDDWEGWGDDEDDQ